MRKEQRKILREDFNVLHEIFDSLDEQKFKREVRERKEREAKEEAERCPTDIAGKPYDLLCYTVVL
jgi:ferredoxin